MAVYADSPTPDPVMETATTAPISPYGISKLASEHYVHQVGAAIGVQPIVLRFFNTYGTRQTDTPYVGVISIFVRKLLRGEIPTIFGDGQQCRDFVHVSDIVAGNLAALIYEGPGCTVNLGTGIASSVNDVANAIRASMKIKQEFPHAETLAGEVTELCRGSGAG
jgi:UDP-glucose 4-epimerase